MIRAAARAAAVALVILFAALGVWQIERRSWKLALIAQVERNVAAAPAPPPSTQRPIDPALAYRRVTVAGRYLPDDTLVQAVTDLGGGYWVMTPLATEAGHVLVNRGFVPGDPRERIAPPPAGPVRIEGLLRPTEPGGGFLRANDPAAGRWYSRDTAAIAAAAGIAPAAPWFVDAVAGDEAGWPRGGMTVVRFRNTHLVYALTWFGMAGLLGFLVWRVSTRRATPA